jgi:serine protease Do
VARILAGGVPKTPSDVRAMEQHVRKAAAAAMQATVGLRVGGAGGSGVIISADGYVLTAGHVSRDKGRAATIIFPDGKSVRGTTLGANLGVDAGLIRITAKPPAGGWPYCEMGSSSGLKAGQWCLATGHPGGYRRGRTPPVRLGRVLRSTSTVLVTDCTIVGGDSGGPVFDMQAKVIGISSRIGGSIEANIHVPVNVYRRDWERLAKGDVFGFRGRRSGGAYLGVTAEVEATDARIASVQPGSAAAKAGLKPGDVIVKFNGMAVPDFPHLAMMISRKKPGDKVKLTVKRGKKTIEVQATLGRRGR